MTKLKSATKKLNKHIGSKFIFTGAENVPVLEDKELTPERIKQEIAYSKKQVNYYITRLESLQKLLGAKS